MVFEGCILKGTSFRSFAGLALITLPDIYRALGWLVSVSHLASSLVPRAPEIYGVLPQTVVRGPKYGEGTAQFKGMMLGGLE